MYALAKFQLDMHITFQVMALQSCNSKMIDLYSRHWENKLQALAKTISHRVVTCTIVYAMNRGIHHCIVLLFFAITENKENSIAYDRFDTTYTKGNNSGILQPTATKQHFQTLLKQANKIMYKFLPLDPYFIKKMCFKIL